MTHASSSLKSIQIRLRSRLGAGWVLFASWVQTEFWLQAGGMVLSIVGWVLDAECRLSAKFTLYAEYRFSVERWISDGCRQSAGWGPVLWTKNELP